MPGESAELAAGVAELQDLLLGTESVDGFLRELAELAARRVRPGLSCGITLQPDGRPLTVASSDGFAGQVDELQYGLDQGPCLHSARTGEEVRIDDLAVDDRWSAYAAHALAYGVRSSLSVPLTVTDRTIGAFNLYSKTTGAFSQAETRDAQRFAQTASGALAIAVRLADQAALTEQLRAALASRSVIDQAIGIIMGQQRCAAEQAFGILRSASQNRNIKLREVAAQMITTVSGARPEPTPFTPS
ncbi:MAG: transcription antitermination regulator [Actinoallomurus sp.]|nr:transcription antitermination regulator [Actinoallomurus sp.]